MTFRIMPHGRLQEWVAEEKGFFADEGLEYDFVHAGDYGIHSVQRGDAGEIKTGYVTESAGQLSCRSFSAGDLGTGVTGYDLVPGRLVMRPRALLTTGVVIAASLCLGTRTESR